jgi:hypothetical protein
VFGELPIERYPLDHSCRQVGNPVLLTRVAHRDHVRIAHGLSDPASRLKRRLSVSSRAGSCWTICSAAAVPSSAGARYPLPTRRRRSGRRSDIPRIESRPGHQPGEVSARDSLPSTASIQPGTSQIALWGCLTRLTRCPTRICTRAGSRAPGARPRSASRRSRAMAERVQRLRAPRRSLIPPRRFAANARRTVFFDSRISRTEHPPGRLRQPPRGSGFARRRRLSSQVLLAKRSPGVTRREGGGCAILARSDSEGNQRARPSSERPLPAKAA